jgi:hypothetical protein
MKRIDFDEFAAWCYDSGYELHDWKPSLPVADRRSTHAVPADIQQVPEVLNALVSLESTERVVWIRDWTIWGERLQDIGLLHLDLLIDSVTDAKPSNSHIYVLHRFEWREAIALLTVPLLFGWDAHLLFRSAAALVNFSPHGEISVFAAPRITTDLDLLLT